MIKALHLQGFFIYRQTTLNYPMPPKEKRKLAAIMFADVVGYSRMMSKDEEKTLDLLKSFEDISTPIVSSYDGSVLKKIGDEIFCEFSSAKNAVDAAIKIQESISNYNDSRPKDFKLLVRIGIHIGDVVKRDGDIHGDGVNVASRIQPLASPGGIAITNSVQDALRSHEKYEIIEKGHHEIKNILDKYSIYQVTTGFEQMEERKQPKSSSKSKIITGAIGISILVFGLLFIVMLNNNTANKSGLSKEKEAMLIQLAKQLNEDSKSEDINIKPELEETINVYIIGIRSPKLEESMYRIIKEELWKYYKKDSGDMINKNNITQLNPNKLDSLYSELLIASTSKSYKKYKLYSRDDTEKMLAQEGKMLTLSELPIIIFSEEYANKDMYVGKYSDIINHIDSNLVEDGLGIYNQYNLYNVDPPIFDKNLLVLADGIDIDKIIETDYNISYGTDMFLTNLDDFIDDVTNNITKDINKTLSYKYPATIINSEKNKVLIELHPSVKPKKYSSFRYEYLYYCDDSFYNTRREDIEGFFAFCDTVQYDIIKDACDNIKNNKDNMYYWSNAEYDDILNDKHEKCSIQDFRWFSFPSSNELIIEEVFDNNTAIVRVKDVGYPTFINFREGTKLFLIQN